MKRREFVSMLAATAGAASMGSALPTEAQSFTNRRRIKAIAFDGFVIFDPRPVAVQVEKEFPGRGAEFTNLWRTRQFEYTWLRTLGNQYKDFWQVTEDALRYTVSTMNLSLTTSQRDESMQTYRSLPVWPDVPETLKELRRRGIRMAFLSNFTAAMLDDNIKAANLAGYFEPHLTTDRVRAFKPSRIAYQMGPDAFGLKPEEIAFAAFAPWDTVGAKWFGYPTVWVNRANAPLDVLDAQPDVVTSDLAGLVSFIG